MAHSLGLEVIGEGVEEKSQQQYLQKENCDMLQGYLFSKPLSASLLPNWAFEQQAKTTQH
jgi:EAL domain-containing protein (putative c-di-GMP-specific phosphodiesterase class I)